MPKERTEALKKWRGARKMTQVTSKYADYSADKSERRPMSGPSAVFAMMPATSCAVEQRNLSLCETALDSDYSETKASGMAEPSKG